MCTVFDYIYLTTDDVTKLLKLRLCQENYRIKCLNSREQVCGPFGSFLRGLNLLEIFLVYFILYKVLKNYLIQNLCLENLDYIN